VHFDERNNYVDLFVLLAAEIIRLSCYYIVL